jgi:hypothetical protein
MKNANKILDGKSVKKRYPLEDPGVERNVILELIIEK